MNSWQPSYSRAGRSIGVIHFGLGAFHRGHQATYFDDALRRGLGEWGIYGISPRSPEVTDRLRNQNFCYTVNARQGEAQDPVLVGSIFDGALFDRANPDLKRAINSPELKLITITVTEKAYVAGIDQESMPNRLLDLLHMRFCSGLSKPTIISCDNLPGNGVFLRNVLLESAAQRELEGDFQQWLARVPMPNSMVDRIVPAITPEAIARFESDFGYVDRSLISTEPFRQWVVEAQPSTSGLAELGIEVSPEVDGYEQVKLRLFNGAHSTTAYFSQLSGIEFVSQAIAIPEWDSFLSRLQREISRSLTAPSAIDVDQYSQVARARIGNSAVAHRSAQIAMDGSAKLPQRLFRTINTLHTKGAEIERTAFAIALWIRFLQSGLPITDPLVDELTVRARGKDAEEAVGLVMQTPGLRNPVIEQAWSAIARYLGELERYTPLEVAQGMQ